MGPVRVLLVSDDGRSADVLRALGRAGVRVRHTDGVGGLPPAAADELVLVDARLLDQRPGDQEPVVVGDLVLHPRTRDVCRGGRPVELTPTGFEVLLLLARHADQVVTKQEVLEAVWGFAARGRENVVELYVGYLRRKLGHGERPFLHTRRGRGYLLTTASPQEDDPGHPRTDRGAEDDPIG